MFFLVAVAAIMASAAGPIYLGAADQSLVTTKLLAAAAIKSGITVSPAQNGYAPPSTLLGEVRTVPGGAGSSGEMYRTPLLTIDLSASIINRRSGRPNSIEIVSRTGDCSHLRVVDGRCPTSGDEVMLSTRSAKLAGLAIGDRIDASSATHGSARLVISGLYVAGNDDQPYWWSANYFPFGGSATGVSLDDGFMTERGAERLASRLASTDWAQLPLRVSGLSAAEAPAFAARLTTWASALATHHGLTAGTSLPAILSGAESEESFARTIVAMVSIELVLLALFVLYAVARATSALRAPDVRVAELRGLPRRRRASLALREPVVLLATALPVGIALSYVVMSVVDRHVLGPGAVSGIGALALEAGAGGFVAGIVSAALGSRALLATTRREETASSMRQRRGRNAVVLDALGLLLGAAGIAELAGQSPQATTSVSPIAYLGPGLVALGAGVAAARLLPLAADLAGRALAWSRHAALTLAARGLARRESLYRQVLVPCIATGLLVFGISGLVVANRNHVMQSQFSVGAPVVLDVQTRPGLDLVAAVQKADPSGTEAMAAADISESDGDTIAVDPSRLAAVASWPAGLSGLSASRAASLLSPRVAPAPYFPRAQSLELSVDAPAVSPRPRLQIDLYDKQVASEDVLNLPAIEPGEHAYSASLEGLCQAGCRIDSILVVWDAKAPGRHASSAQKAEAEKQDSLAGHYMFRIVSISARISSSRSARVSVVSAGWAGTGGAATVPTKHGIEVLADLPDSPAIKPADLPKSVPVIATGTALALDSTPAAPDQLEYFGLDGSELTGTAAHVVPVLPRVGANATMVSLDLAETEQEGPLTDVTLQVWCRAPPSRELLKRLSKQGVTVVSTERATKVLSSLDRSGPALGFDMYGLAAAGAALLAVGAVLFSVASDARRRRIEFAGLAAVGVPRSLLKRCLVIESSVTTVVGVLAGGGAAVLSAFLALRFLPEFAPGRVGPPLQTGLPWADVLAMAAAMLVVLEGAAVAADVALVRGVRPELLRLSQ